MNPLARCGGDVMAIVLAAALPAGLFRL